MRLLGVDAAVGDQAKEVQAATAATSMFHRAEQRGVGEEFAVFDHQLDPGDVHVHDAARTDIEMPDFAVAHLPLGQTHVFATGVNQGIGIFAEQAIVSGLAREGNGIRLGLRAVTPAV